ncbi:hypothetical protein C1H46_041607 [Malus baccata]|uniref:Tyrosine decarboxylase n=1 Tax=Malus baccata TaxID=106549 RepID=A0A540KF57_MALBA|nr:hypothetical protein C1H46_041607 [Malus baccata]
MKLWLVLRSYGVANLRNFLRSHVKMAKIFEGLGAMDKRFEIVAPRNFSLVCFRVSPSSISNKASSDQNGKPDYCCDANGDENSVIINEVNRKLLESINVSGHVYMTHGVVGGLYMLRFAVGATLTEEHHIALAWKVVQEHADEILIKY